jgi:ubiquinone/menaquinone biosynthesis C-methylase UbiE
MSERLTITTARELGSWYDEHYLEMGGTWQTPADEIEEHLNFFGLPYDQNLRLLDIGCGGGQFLAAAEKRVGCTGIDLSKVALDEARTRVSEHTALHLMDAEKLGFPNAWFDYVVSLGSLEHAINLAQALREIRRVLRPGGKWYFFVPNEEWVHQDQPNEQSHPDDEWRLLFETTGLPVDRSKRWNDSTMFVGRK